MSKYYYIAPWVWEKNEDGAFWRPPAGVIGLFDLRGLVNSGEYGLFVTQEPMREPFALQVGDGTDLREYQTTIAEREAWRFLLGLKLSDLPDSTTLFRDVLIQTFETCGDPDGGALFLPPTVTSQGNLEFFLGGHSLISRRKFRGVNDPAWPRIQALLHRQYGNMAARGIEARKRLLSTWMQKYGLADERLFQPPGLNEKPEKPHTTITDNFNRADGDIGSSSEGWSWTQVDANFDVLSNQAKNVGGTTYVFPSMCRAEIDLSSDDHYAQVTCIAVTLLGFFGPVVRFNPAAKTGYVWRARTTATQRHALDKIIAGASTNLVNDTVLPSLPAVQKLSADGSTLRMYIDGSEYTALSPVTDTSITGYLRTGGAGHSYNTNPSTGDDFSAADLAVAAIMNQLQGPNLGADLFNGAIQ